MRIANLKTWFVISVIRPVIVLAIVLFLICTSGAVAGNSVSRLEAGERALSAAGLVQH